MSAIPRKVLYPLLVFSLCAYSVTAERARGRIIHLTRIENSEETTINLRPREFAAVFLKSDERIITGIVCEIAPPAEVARYRDAFILNVYADANPEPAYDRLDYTVRESYFIQIDNRNPTRIVIPFTDRAISDPNVIEGLQFADSPLLISIEPVSKALPDSIASVLFTLTLSGIFTENGIIRVRVETPAGKVSPFVLRIDGEEVIYRDAGYVASGGFHKIEVIGDNGNIHRHNVLVEAGLIHEISVVLESRLPTVKIDAPADASIFLDGQRYVPEVHGLVEVSEGEHTVLMMLSDFSISRSFIVEKDNDYTISLFLDILIEER